jgi:ribosomal protein S18 acetylase RimI-like enzyme
MIRTYQPADLPHLKRITVEAFSGVSIDRRLEELFGEIHGHNWQWRKARHIDEDVARDPQGVFVAEENGAVVGYITTWIDREAGLGFIPNLAVEREQRGQGLGRQLIERALHHFREAGIRHVRIETLAHNDVGQHLYPSCGFREVARQIHYGLCLDDLPAPEATRLKGSG